MTKVYFVDVRGNLIEYEKVERKNCGWAAPGPGCDMLIRDAQKHLSSANSEHYHDTPQLALEDFLERQKKSIVDIETRLQREKDYWLNAHSQLSSLTETTT